MIGLSAGKSYAYILGVYLGDGCVTYTGNVNTKTFRLNTIDYDFAQKTADALYDLIGKKPNIRTYKIKRGRDDNQLGVAHKELCEKLVNDTEYKKRIPSYVYKWPVEMRKDFVIGLMDSEGFIAKNKAIKPNRCYYMGFKCTSEWTRELSVIMQGIGLRIGKISEEKPRKEGYKTPIRFHIKMKSWIDSGLRFNIKRKQDRVDEWASQDAYVTRSRYPRRLTSETTRQTA